MTERSSTSFFNDVANIELLPNHRVVSELLINSRLRAEFSSKKKLSDVRSALFSERGDFFSRSNNFRAGISSLQTRFDGFGVDERARIKLDRWETAFFTTGLPKESFGICAPARTFQILLDSWLGYDVDKLLASVGENYNELYTERLSRLERALLQRELLRLVAPRSFFNEKTNATAREEIRDWRVVFDAIELDEYRDSSASYYWERRAFVILGALFPWVLFIPASRLVQSKPIEIPIDLSDESLSDDRSTDERRERAITTSSGDARLKLSSNASKGTEKNIVRGTLSERDSQGGETCELTVEIGTGEATSEEWSQIRPGSLLTTDIPKDVLFLARANGRPLFYAKPGVYREMSAVQVKKFVE